MHTMDGCIRIGNNLCEYAVRPVDMGRKIWLFAASVAGVNRSAKLYSLVETAKAIDNEPHRHIQHVLTHLPTAQSLDEVEALLGINIQSSKCRGT